MKTFNEEDFITWSNRDKAVIGNEYYFGNSIDDLRLKILEADTFKLENIIDNSFSGTFKNHCDNYYPCILPVDAVKDTEPEKKYRPCKTVKDFYELVNNTQCKMSEEECIYQLISDCIIHFRSKNTGTEYYSTIRSISISEDVGIKILMTQKTYLSFIYLFNTFEIEINGEWLPFGVLENEIHRT